MKRKKVTVSPLASPRYALDVTEKPGHGIPHAEGRTEQRAYVVTIHTKVFVPIARLDITARLPERPAPAVRLVDGIAADPSRLEGSFPKTDSEGEPTKNLGVNHQYH